MWAVFPRSRGTTPQSVLPGATPAVRLLRFAKLKAQRAAIITHMCKRSSPQNVGRFLTLMSHTAVLVLLHPVSLVLSPSSTFANTMLM